MAILTSKKAQFRNHRAVIGKDGLPAQYIQMEEEQGELTLSSKTYDLSKIPLLDTCTVEADVTFRNYKGSMFVTVNQISVKPLKA
jgi:hypothetical protein